MLEFDNCDEGKPAIIKKECSDAENVDENITNWPKNEDILGIKCEEIDIKEELDITTEISISDHSQKYGSVGNNASSNKNIRKGDSEGKKHFCPKCPYSSIRNHTVKRHMRIHLNNKQHKCLLCTYITDNKLSLRAHMSSHKGPTKEFGYHKYQHKTDRSHSLKQHFLGHKDMLGVEIYICSLCPFTSKYKSALGRHQSLQHDENIIMYKCKGCSFTTKYRNSFLRHHLVHADPTVVNKFKCEKCPYWSKRQGDLKQHMMTHSKKLLYNNKEIHKCELCVYQTTTAKAFKAHITINHPDPLIEPQKCAYCSYKTIFRRLLSKHMNRLHKMQSHSLIHQDATFQSD